MTEKSSETLNFIFFRLAGACGILGSVLPLFMVLLATFQSTWFSWNVNALSELGVGEQAGLFNCAMLIGGVLNFLFALGLKGYLGKERLIRAGIISILLSCVSLALVGVFTIDYLLPHGVAALGYFMLTPTGFLLIGAGKKDRISRKLSYGCGVAALIAILGLPVIVLALPLRIGFAVPELIEGLIISAWTIFMSVRLLRHHR